MTSTEFFEWNRRHAGRAAKRYTARGLSKRVKADVGDAVWEKARCIFEEYIERIQILRGPRVNLDKNDPLSLGHFQRQLQNDVTRWMDSLAQYIDDSRLVTFSETAADDEFFTMGGDCWDGRGIIRRLESLYLTLCDVSIAVNKVRLSGIEVEHEADARRRCGQKLKQLAAASGIDGKRFVAAFNIYADARAETGFNEWYQSLN